jgi:DNA polymerase
MHDSITQAANTISKMHNISNSQEVNANNYQDQDIRKLLSGVDNLADLIQVINNFDGCELKNLAINTVIADGNPNSKIMLLGEAPGVEEDEQGIPFCGQSGQLLDNMMSSIGLFRKENIYITNTMFWRPPENRKPTTKEIEICRPFLEKHIALINPKLIIAVGATAAATILGKNFEITKMRRQYFQYTNSYITNSIAVTAIFHPAYLLRQSRQKKNTWYDLLEIKDYIKTNIDN